MRTKLVVPSLRVAGLALVLFAVASTATASASEFRWCGTERALSNGSVFAVKAKRVRCNVALDVAGRWYYVQSHGSSARQVYDRQGRRWSCRITEHATGTDPGYNPHTRVRCARRLKVVRFKLRS